MIECDTLDEARAVPGVIHIESGPDGIFAYVQGDTLPAWCQPVVPNPTDQ